MRRCLLYRFFRDGIVLLLNFLFLWKRKTLHCNQKKRILVFYLLGQHSMNLQNKNNRLSKMCFVVWFRFCSSLFGGFCLVGILLRNLLAALSLFGLGLLHYFQIILVGLHKFQERGCVFQLLYD